ncbi:phage holin [Sporolactobacillus sp. CQH2019]|uniref:phage holin n=1 Tax=Sporolactobacillus sp. CQH2019 TaxID=3023512 RepID=UPI0023682135|nr:phage holin [Sporolactobacillus sp. CQH2019]MDD9148172.1 phage holin [Sporolactobacillus sp. CQH2019]
MKINWIVRLKNPVFIAQLVISVLLPILAYAGLTGADVTSWPILIGLIVAAVKNPYVLALVIVSVWHTVNDPTTSGLSDSDLALKYKAPYKDK